MFQLLIILTGLVIAGAAYRSYKRTRDPLSPAIVFAPMLLYMYAYSPFMLSRSEDLYLLLDEGQLSYVQMLNFCGVSAFMAGCLAFGRLGPRPDRTALNQTMQMELRPSGRQIMFRLACLLGVIGTGAFLYNVEYSGGWLQVFSEGKPALRAPTGYLGEAPLLCYAAIILLAISLQGRQLQLQHLLLVFLFALPHLTTATLGGRRGPAFLIIATLGLAYFLYRGMRPKLTTVLIALTFTGILMLFLVSNRSNIHLGSEFDFDEVAFLDRLTLSNSVQGNEYTYAAGLALTTEHHGTFGWGMRYVTMLLIRPIPKAIWPTKYRDLGVQHWVTEPGRGGFTDDEWIEAVGFLPLTGSAGGIIVDLYREFSWLVLVPLYWLGRLYARTWRGWITRGGFYTLAYVQMLALSIYLPSQSLGAWGVRLLLLIVPTYLLWRYLVLPRLRHRGMVGSPIDADAALDAWSVVPVRPTR